MTNRGRTFVLSRLGGNLTASKRKTDYRVLTGVNRKRRTFFGRRRMLTKVIDKYTATIVLYTTQITQVIEDELDVGSDFKKMLVRDFDGGYAMAGV